jgi:hypothetical protein
MSIIDDKPNLFLITERSYFGRNSPSSEAVSSFVFQGTELTILYFGVIENLFYNHILLHLKLGCVIIYNGFYTMCLSYTDDR